jgi:uncharacterized protein (TIGR02270 family)
MISPPDSVLGPVLAHHASEAAFLWSQRDRAVLAPHVRLRHLAALDDRLDAHLDGLRLAGDFGWDLCAAGLEDGGPGEVFAAAVLAFDGGTEPRVRLVLEKGPSAPPRARAVVSALGWLPYERVKGIIAQLAGSRSIAQRYVAIAAAVAHRRPPSLPLSRALGGDPWLDARVFRAAGELGAGAARGLIAEGLKHADEGCRFWAAWSGVLVSDEPAPLATLLDFAEAGGPHAEAAARLAARRLDPRAAGRWVRRLADQSRAPRTAVIAAGVAGGPGAAPWLIEQMKSPALARIAAEAFAAITGADLDAEHLDGPPPQKVETGPTDDPEDENVALDEDDHLPWPSVEAVQNWWAGRRGAFPADTRYLLGSPVTVDGLRHTLRAGPQRQRAAAAVELALRQPGSPLFEVRAPGFRQQALLGEDEGPDLIPAGDRRHVG